MSDEKKTFANDGWTVSQKGYTPAKAPDSSGYQPATGSLGTPPTTGSAVSKPAPEKKGQDDLRHIDAVKRQFVFPR